MKSPGVLTVMVCMLFLLSPAHAYDRPGRTRPGGYAAFRLIQAELIGRDVLLVFRVPPALEIQCAPMQLRIGRLAVEFREIRDYRDRTASFVLNAELYESIDGRTLPTVLTACYSWITAPIYYPPIDTRARPRHRRGY